MSIYGAKFDKLALRWGRLENEHDHVHPNRDECGGVGGCVMMRQAVDLEHEMMAALDEWRLR